MGKTLVFFARSNAKGLVSVFFEGMLDEFSHGEIPIEIKLLQKLFLGFVEFFLPDGESFSKSIELVVHEDQQVTVGPPQDVL